ncbi:hypothetical protein TVAG_462730 [Trichomonas vaginalis G3]|uniref:DUF3447 domain-containing protein n=1 Tax=Trichomonas vaginalis (strain ATCC PRA-98 / G3) TaxID=412133 RepID=A2DLY4_TRIV3|nr:protein of unknown function (DUF3447) [Trichomonas vaginalis G3]EAY18587.1 hypothetical protein TVAG_462730 [Trichomonas vaginalis G3]KAI5491615.1 protein of unknown function (DUF3447) [Trichomonas vaginalis G3]|eukprot:XP_001579573.1 hypothetical protein [Trichomonas vaginalis G3]
MSDQYSRRNKFTELRSIHKSYIDLYNALYQVKTEKEEDLNTIYKNIQTELIDSMKFPPQSIIRDILKIIPYNNRYVNAYLTLAKRISDDYHVEDVSNVEPISNYMFYKEYGIKLDKSRDFNEINKYYLDIHTKNTIYKVIMNNDIEKFIFLTGAEGFNEHLFLESDLYPYTPYRYTLLDICCYHGAIDCFKFLRTKFNSKISDDSLRFSFLGGNPEIMSECLKYKKPYEECMKYAIISHNIGFVTFLMNEYNLKIDLKWCRLYNNLESFLVYFDQTKNINECFLNSIKFNIPPLCEYILSCGANIHTKNRHGNTALHKAVNINSKEMVEFLLSHGANINEKNKNGDTVLHFAAFNNSKEMVEFLLSPWCKYQ